MLEILLNDHQLYMSKFQHDHLITIRAGGTLYGQYKQSLRELYKRVRGYRETTANRDLLIVDIDELQFQLENNDLGQFEKRRKEIEFIRKTALLEESNRVVNETAREGARFYQQAVALKEQIGDLTPEKRKQLDFDMWVFKIKQMAFYDFVTTGRVGRNAFEYACALPADARPMVMDLIGKPKALETDIQSRMQKTNQILKCALAESRLLNSNQSTFEKLLEGKNGELYGS